MSVDLPEQLNMAEYFLDRRISEGRGDRVALRLPEGDLTYREVQQLAHRFGNALRQLGVRAEERVLIALPDGAEFVGAFFGILEIGAAVVMLNPGFSAESIAELLDYTGASLAVVSADLRPQYEAARELRPQARLRGLLVVGSDSGSHASWNDLGPQAEDSLTPAPTHRDDPAVWLFSGGTTGRPKAVVQTHGSFVNTTVLYAQKTLHYGENDRTLSVPKLYFGYATGSNLLFPFSVGASAILFPEPTTADRLFELIARHRATILINVPTMVQKMVSHPEADGMDLSSLRLATSAGEALPPPLHERWNHQFEVDLLDGLGTAEMWHIFVTNRPGDVRPGTLGRVVEGFEIAVRGPEGEPRPVGEVGRLWVRGRSRALGYWRNLDRTSTAFVGEWFVGGDLVSIDAAGYVTYCGRGDDALKVGGKWCVPAEVEGVLMAHPAVEECAVVGVTNSQGLTKPIACVRRTVGAEADDQTLGEALKQFVLERLQPYKHPRQVVFFDEFPRTHLGKVDRGQLKRVVQDAAE